MNEEGLLREPLKNKSDASHNSSRLQKMCSAERRQEIVERYLVHQICDVNRCRESLAFFRMEQIVSAQTEVEYVARSDAIRVVIVVFSAGLRQCQQPGGHGFASAVIRPEARAKRGHEVTTGQAN